MNLLKRLLGKKAGPMGSAEFESVLEDRPKPSMALIFLFDQMPRLDLQSLTDALESTGPLSSPLRIFDSVSTGSGQYARLAFDEEHQFRWFGVQSPAPADSTEQPIECSHWRPQDKEPLRRHQAHAICWYEGTTEDPTERMIALMRLAGAFSGMGLVGVIDTDAWNCIPVHVLTQMLEPAMLQACRDAVPVGLWTGFVKFSKSDDEMWFCTKGFHRWGVRDFAVVAAPGEAQRVSGMFSSLFNYAHQSEAVMEVGHTAQFGDQLLRFASVTEYAEYIDSPLGTLVVERNPQMALAS